MVRTEHFLSAAFAALVFTTPAFAQAPSDTATAAVTLAQALQKSRQVAPSVVAAEGSVRTAQLATRSAIWQFIPALTIQPQMALNISSSQHIDPITGVLVNGSTSTPQYSFGASATYTIFDGFARNHTLTEQRANEAAAETSLITSQYSNDLTVTNDFFTALADKQLVAVAQTNLDAAKAQLQLASAKLQAGSGVLSDSLTALGNYLEAQLGVLQAQANLIVGESNLGHDIGVAGHVAAVDDSAYYATPPVIDTAAIRQEIMNTAPSLVTLQKDLVAAQQATKVVKAGYWPTLSANAAQSWTGYWAGDNAGSGLTPRYSVNIMLSINPWTNLSRETQIANAEVRVANADASLADQQNLIAAEINQAYASLATAEETIAVTNAAVAAGKENSRVVTERYQTGIATITDVLTAQQQLVTAQSNQVQARYSYLRAKAQLEQILGRSLNGA